jgi:GNAT superfamily N-acetyltransferase
MRGVLLFNGSPKTRDPTEAASMSITQARYKALADFPDVFAFLAETYDPITLNSYLLPHCFEYAHTHPSFNHKMTHRNGLWRDGDAIVGIACYETELGDCHLHARKGYERLLPEMLLWSEKELCAADGGKRTLGVWITDKEPKKWSLLLASGYTKTNAEAVKVYRYDAPFPERGLPDGFTLIDGSGVDYAKLHTCFWKGFDRGNIPDDDVDGNVHMFNAPHADLSLMTIATAPDGEYACALGVWLDVRNAYAYLEPLATIPEYRRMGLATAALSRAMQKTKDLGAKYCFGGAHEFYDATGFKTVCNREVWRKEWGN